MFGAALTAKTILDIVDEIKCVVSEHKLVYKEILTKNPCHVVYQCSRCKEIFVHKGFFLHKNREESRKGCQIITHCNDCNEDIFVQQKCTGPWEWAESANTKKPLRSIKCACGHVQQAKNPDYHEPERQDRNDDDDDGYDVMIQSMM